MQGSVETLRSKTHLRRSPTYRQHIYLLRNGNFTLYHFLLCPTLFPILAKYLPQPLSPRGSHLSHLRSDEQRDKTIGKKRRNLLKKVVWEKRLLLRNKEDSVRIKDHEEQSLVWIKFILFFLHTELLKSGNKTSLDWTACSIQFDSS